ncbi:MAG: hypothetical protein GY803_28220 [Chloroflexi bacterium]|nr:hypothetical protein [Chloroflexota bacterium]
MSSIFGLFNIFSLIYIFRSLQLTATVWREWSTIRQEPLNPRKKSLAEQASFFIAVPIGVFLHELGHALAVWLFGGEVLEFGYRVFWGYVLHPRTGVPAQEWFISLAGTLASLLFGVAIWLALKNNVSSSLRYFGLRALRFQGYFSTIYYPIFTLLGFEEDWKMIYDFGATPILSGLTIPFHLGLVLLFYWGDRTGWFERPSHQTISDRDQFTSLRQQASLEPHNTRLQLQYIDALRQSGAINQAKTKLKAFIRQNPDSGTAYLQLAVLDIANKSQIPKRASQHLRQALNLGLPNPSSLAYAHQLLGKYNLDRNQPEEAIIQLNQALAQKVEGETMEESRRQSALYCLRSQAYRRQQQYQPAYQDIQQAIALAQQTGDEKLTAYYREEQAIIQNHAGHKVENLTDLRR